MRLRFTPEALAEIDGVLADAARHSPQRADRLQGRLSAVMALLLDHPHAGRITSARPMRRIAATPEPYLIFYEPVGDEVVIVAVRHGARDPSSMPGHV